MSSDLELGGAKHRARDLFSRSWIGALSIALTFLALAAWGFSSPIGSSPDDDYHLASIWCGLGERPGLCEPGASDAERAVPRQFTDARCYTFRPDESAACFDASESGLTSTDRVDVKGAYPPVFYAVMGTFATTDVQTSVLVMRLFNAALACVLWSVAFFLVRRSDRPALIVSVVATCVPLGTFLIASTNPSSWAIAVAPVIWFAAWAALRSEGARRIGLSVLIIVATAIGAGARADAALFAVAGMGVGIVMGFRALRPSVIPLAAMGLSAIIALLLYRTAQQGDALSDGLVSATPPLTTRQLVENVLQLPSLFSGVNPGWGLGWLDTNLPASVWVAVIAVMGAVTTIGLRRVHWRRATALILVAVALCVMPLYLLAQTHALVGTQVQPRYLLPLLIIFFGLTAATSSAAGEWRGPRQWILSVVVVFVMCVSLHVNLRRYTTGVDDAALDPGRDAEWWWVGAPSPFAVWVVGSLALAGLLALLALRNRRAEVGGANDARTLAAAEDASHGVSTYRT